jgi:hypothetical protein
MPARSFGAALVHVDAHAAFVLRAGNAVERGKQARAGADEAARSDPRAAERGAVGADGRAGERADGCVGVAGFAMHRVGVQREIFGAAVDAHHAGALVVDRAGAQLGAPFQGCVGQRFGYAAVDDVHRTADGAAAVEQGGRTLEDFDLVGEEGFDGHRVVCAHRRHVARTQAIAHHLDARTVEAAHDRAADAGPEIRRLHARQLADRFAEAVGLGFVELFAGEDIDGPGHLVGGGRQQCALDLDGVQVLRVAVVLVGAIRGRLRRRGGIDGKGRGGEDQQQGGNEGAQGHMRA